MFLNILNWIGINCVQKCNSFNRLFNFLLLQIKCVCWLLHPEFLILLSVKVYHLKNGIKMNLNDRWNHEKYAQVLMRKCVCVCCVVFFIFRFEGNQITEFNVVKCEQQWRERKKANTRTHTQRSKDLQFMQISFDKSALNLLKVDCGIESARIDWPLHKIKANEKQQQHRRRRRKNNTKIRIWNELKITTSATVCCACFRAAIRE